MDAALAIDIGGTKVEACLVDEHGRILEGTRRRAATGAAAARDRAVAERAFREVIDRTLAAAPGPVVRAGVGSAGPVDLATGTISPINLPSLRDFPITELVAQASGIGNVTLRLDGTCIALSELWLGAAREVADAIVIVVSTGVGGGIVSGGRLVAGASGNAGHLGQVVVERVEDGDPAAATVEGIASGPHTIAWARRRGWTGETGEQLSAAYAAGDGIAVEAVARSAWAVGVGLADAATLLDLELAVIGGGFAAVADDYVERVQDAVERVSVNAYARRMRVVRAELGGDAPLVGAAALVHRPDLLT